MKKENIIKIKGADDKEYFAEIIKCEFKDCNELATVRLTQDNKFYCDKHGQEEVGNFIKVVNSLGGFA